MCRLKSLRVKALKKWEVISPKSIKTRRKTGEGGREEGRERERERLRLHLLSGTFSSSQAWELKLYSRQHIAVILIIEGR